MIILHDIEHKGRRYRPGKMVYYIEREREIYEIPDDNVDGNGVVFA